MKAYRLYAVLILTFTIILSYGTGAYVAHEKITESETASIAAAASTHQIPEKNTAATPPRKTSKPPEKVTPSVVYNPKNSTVSESAYPSKTPSKNIGKNPVSSAGVLYRTGPSNAKKIALTFDDGPDAKYTGQILDILKQYNIKATFFVIGKRVSAYPETVRRIANEGHAIGNHTWSHPDLTKISQKDFLSQLNETNSLLKKIIGYTPLIVRPPFGSVNATVIQEAKTEGLKLITWSVDTRDWEGISKEKIMENVKKEVKPGGIILQHSSGGKNGNLSNTVEALPQIIEYLKENHYEFVTVPELLNINNQGK